MSAQRIDPPALRAWLEGVAPVALLPPRLSDGPAPEGRPRVMDEVVLAPDLALVLAALEDASVIVPVAVAEQGFRRATPGDGAFAALASLVREGGTRGPIEVQRLGEVPPADRERGIDVDQSNDSVVVGERLVVKLFPRAAEGPQPGETLPAHLAAVGSTDVPTPYGSLRWRLADGSTVLAATVTAYLSEATDGWSWFLELALDEVAGGPAGASVAAADACGRLVGRLHLALATPSAILGSAPVGSVDASSWTAPARALLEDAVRLTTGDEGRRLSEMAPRIAAALTRFDAAGPTPVQRIHGDLHVGQILRGPHGYAVTDFDGNPLAPATERTAPQPAARDVAAFVRSLDHLGRLAQRRLPGSGAAAGRWIGAVRERFLDAYTTTLQAAGRRDLFDDRLLPPFEVLQECHEYVYAARYLPRWLPIPDLAMPRLLDEVVP